MLAFKRTLLSVSIAAGLSACVADQSGQAPDPDSLIEPAAPQEQTPNLSHQRQNTVSAAEETIVVTGSKLHEPESWGSAAADLYYGPQPSRENYGKFEDNGVKLVSREPVSTFSIDVDTGSYSNVRRFLNDGRLPPEDAVRTEELVNYFSYDYHHVNDDGTPFSIDTEISLSPWHPGRHLLQVGIQALEPDADKLPPSNLVFLLDVSGSMNSPHKLDLLKTSLKMLSRQLKAEDRISLVVYAGASGVVLEPTAGDKSDAINLALDRLQAGGSTNGAAGIELAYQLARKTYIEDGINRVILATDGDFNVGTTDFDSLKDMVEKKRKSGISLTTLGFGSGNYNDHLMEQLADAGNGNYAYIDNLSEARKVLVDEISSTLQTVAQDVKIQIEFNPEQVSEYRLIGYENRALEAQDFNNDKVDAGEIGAGHTVTALYELTLTDSTNTSLDPLRYANAGIEAPGEFNKELAFLKLRYKEPGEENSKLLSYPLLNDDIISDINATSTNYRFAAAVAGFAQLLRDNEDIGGLDYDAVLALAGSSRGEDPFGYRSEFLNLVRTAQVLSEN